MKPGRGGLLSCPRGQWIYTLHAFGVTISLVEAGERMEHCTQTKKEKTDQKISGRLSVSTKMI